MEKKSPKADEQKKEKKYAYIGALSGVWFILKPVDGNLRDMNLGQTCDEKHADGSRTEQNKYKINTGIGYSFEDLFASKMRAQGHKVEQVPMMTNGADFIIDGVPCQCKTAKTPEAVLASLFKNGKERYAGQVIITDAGNEARVRELINHNAEKFHGNLPEVNPEGWAKVTRQEANAQRRSGWKSAFNDTKDIMRDPKSQKHLAMGMIGTFLAVIALQAGIEYKRLRQENPEEPCLKRMGRAAKAALAKRWKGAAIAASAVGVSILAATVINRQKLRPA